MLSSAPLRVFSLECVFHRLLRFVTVALLLTVGLLGGVTSAAAVEPMGPMYWKNHEAPSGEFEGFGDAARFVFSDDLHRSLAGISLEVTSSSDQRGLSVMAKRDSYASSYYRGSFRFTGGPTDQARGALHVEDGDTVTLSYRRPHDPLGALKQHTIARMWRAKTRPPDDGQLLLAEPDGADGVLSGARGAAPAGAVVRVFDLAAPAIVLASGRADSEGRFRVSGPADLPATVGVTAQEDGLPVSPPVTVTRAGLTGTVVVPGTELGLTSAMVEVRAVGEADPCAETDNCTAVSAFTDHDGRFKIPVEALRQAGSYDIWWVSQGVPDGAEFDAAAYSRKAGPVRVEAGSSTSTVDAGPLPMLPPVFTALVRDGEGGPVFQAQADVFDATGDLVRGGYSRRNGRFGLHLLDGDYRLRVRGPLDCGSWSETSIEVSVQGGVASPAAAELTIERVSISEAGWVMPVDPGPLGTRLIFGSPSVDISLPDAAAGELTLRCLLQWDEGLLVDPPIGIDLDSVTTAQVCRSYQPARSAALGLVEESLRLLRRDADGQVRELPAVHDLQDHVLCADTDQLAEFAVGVREHDQPPPSPPEPSPEPPPDPTTTDDPAPGSSPTPSPSGPDPAPEPAPVPGARSIDASCPPHRVPPNPFIDVPTGSTHERAISCLVWWKVANGRTATTYAPRAGVTRDAMAAFVARTILEAKPWALSDSPPDAFGDDNASVHQKAINQLAAVGIVGGTGGGNYGPHDGVTRGQMARFLANAVKHVGGSPLPIERDLFSDDNTNLFQDDINRVAQAGLTGGRTDGTYDPLGPVLRDQMGSFLARTLDLFVADGAQLPG